jgi:transaldolase
MPSKLDQLRAMTVVVGDTGDIDAVRRLKPQDCTTNPSLVLKAVSTPAGKEILAEAVRWADSLNANLEARTIAACDRVAVAIGTELTRIVPGRVSTEVDADLSFNVKGSIEKAQSVIAAYAARGVPRERILIKLASTWEGIQAARELQKQSIDCNLTLLFSLTQAMAAADAGAFLISPFVGRILDWHVKNSGKSFTAETDPGVASVRSIYATYKARGAATVVMGASFRNTGEIEALAGCDRLTIAPALLDELAGSSEDLPRVLAPTFTAGAKPWIRFDEAGFRFSLNEDAMATEKLAEGIRLFFKDLRALRTLVQTSLERTSRTEQRAIA